MRFPIVKFTLVLSFSILSIVAFAQTDTEEAIPESAASPVSVVTEPVELEKKKKTKKEEGPTEEEKLQEVFTTIQEGDSEAVEALVKARQINHYRHSEEGETPLTIAIKNNDVDKVKLLVKDALENYKNTNGETPLTLAIKVGNPEVTRLVMRRAKSSLRNEFGETPLFLAIAKGDIILMQDLISKGADVDIKTKGITPLSQAAVMNNHRAVSLLIKRGAIINKENEDGTIPLYLAIQMDHDLIAGMLINKSKDPINDANWKNKMGEPLINLAAKKGNPAILKMLINAGAKVTDTDFEDNTPLHIAAAKGNVDAVKFILDQEVTDIDIQNSRGATPLVMAAIEGQHKTYQQLLTRGANANLMDYAGNLAKDYMTLAQNGVQAKSAIVKDDVPASYLIQAVEVAGSNYASNK